VMKSGVPVGVPRRGDLKEDRSVRRRALAVDDNAAFFQTVLPSRAEPLGNPGGAQSVGRVGIDTPLVAAMPPNPASDH
jgi:hypothetical protein